MDWFIAVPVLGIVGLLFAVGTYLFVLRYNPGNERMRLIASEIHKGAMVFLRREYQVIAIFMIVVSSLLAVFVSPYTALAYLFGGLSSMLAGFFGMKAATRSSGRTCQGAIDGGRPRALFIAFMGGSVMGITIAALGVFGVGVLFLITHDPVVITGFAFGASSIALFARVGGGIYTKSADVGTDLVGKVEAGIPEDDPRNPGVIADNVGDCVGDTAGMGADLFESYVGSVIATIALGATGKEPFKLMLYPILLIALGLIASMLGVLSINLFKKIKPQSALRFTIYVSGVIFIVAAYLASKMLFGDLKVFISLVAGLVVGVLIGIESEYFTSGRPIIELAHASESGPATTLITGLAIAFQSTILPVITIALGVVVAYYFSGLYGVAISAVGMLATIGVVMSTDSYGPIADNAGGIAEMSHAGPEIRKITDELDALGNTTAAIGKGFAIGSAALTALALFSAYQQAVGLSMINLAAPLAVSGLFIGAMMPFAVASMTMKAVGRAANKMVAEIRRQFKEIKGLLDGNAMPDTGACIDIVTKAAIREMLLPGISAVVVPLIVGLLMGTEALGGFLAGATVSGLLVGVFMANGGAAFDNAKKWIEGGNLGGKGTPVHAAAIVGDTVGDPLKDTSGPSMNILIKLMSIVSLVTAPVLVKYGPRIAEFIKGLL